VGGLAFHAANGLPGASAGILVVTVLVLALLLMIGIVALPPMRARFHDSFERTHRFGGWSVLLLFWAQTVILASDQRGATGLGSALISSPGFWILIILTISIILPWLRLRKVAVEIETPSSHVALTRFNHGVTPFAGSSTTISRNPLLEWHAFANVPAPGEEGFRLAISRAGDWTGEFIDDTPSHVWVKAIPTAGVGNIDKLFKRVVWVATGSGIGPVLPHLLAKTAPAHLIWSTRDARQTYGDAFVDEILEAEPDAIIWDTTKDGRPDLVELAYKAYSSFGAEAVICISNKKLTWQVVHGMESLGIPAYGAIWDS
jgi:predicted ferric reductase